MAKEITKAYILQQIQDKFKLRELTPETFQFSETVVPTYDISEHLVTRVVERKSISVSSAAAYIIFDVPETEKYTLYRYSVVFVSGSYTLAGCYVIRGVVANAFVYLDLAVAKSISYTVDLPKPAIFGPGDAFKVNVDGYTSTGTLYVYYDIVKEEIR